MWVSVSTLAHKVRLGCDRNSYRVNTVDKGITLVIPSFLSSLQHLNCSDIHRCEISREVHNDIIVAQAYPVKLGSLTVVAPACAAVNTYVCGCSIYSHQ